MCFVAYIEWCHFNGYEERAYTIEETTRFLDFARNDTAESFRIVNIYAMFVKVLLSSKELNVTIRKASADAEAFLLFFRFNI